MIELNKIYNEDCLVGLKRIPNNFVDLVITSPPYNMNLRISNNKYTSRQVIKELSTKYKDFDDNLPIDEYNNFHTKVLKELLRVSNLVFYNIAIVTGSKRSVFKMIGDFKDYLKEIIVWDKGYGQPAMKKQVLNRRTELILVFENDNAISRQFKKAMFERGKLDDLWLINREVIKHKTYHGAKFPKKLVEKIIKNFSKEKEIILDPFIGSGTTAIACLENNRNYIGFEISKEYCDLANKRINDLPIKLL